MKEEINLVSIVIDYISSMFVFASFNYFDLYLKGKDSTPELRAEFVDKCEKFLMSPSILFTIEYYKIDYKIVYDETLWPSDVPYGCIQRLHLKPQCNSDHYIIHLDLTMDKKTGVSFLTSNGLVQVDLFKGKS